MTKSILLRGSVVPEGEPVKYGLLQPALMLPSYALGYGAAAVAGAPDPHRAGYRVTAFLFSPLLVAAIAAVSFRASRRLGKPPGRAAALAWLLVFATLLLPYARHLFSEPLNALLLLLFGTALVRGVATPGEAARAVLPLALLFLNNAVFGALLLLGTALVVSRVRRASGARGALSAVAACGALAGAAAAITLLYNQARFGRPLVFGYGDEGFTGSFLEGLEGLTVSVGRGVLWYGPLTVAALVVAVRGALVDPDRDRRGLFAFAGSVLLAHVLLYATWSSFEGGWCWGPRFLLPFVPLAHLALARVEGRGPAGLAPVLVVVAALGLAVNAWEYASDWRHVERALYEAGGDAAYRRSLFEPALTPALRASVDPALLAQFAAVAVGSAWLTRRIAR